MPLMKTNVLYLVGCNNDFPTHHPLRRPHWHYHAHGHLGGEVAGMTDADKAAEEARALLRCFLRTDGDFDHPSFLQEMEARSKALRSKKLTKKELKHLGKIVAAFMQEQRI